MVIFVQNILEQARNQISRYLLLLIDNYSFDLEFFNGDIDPQWNVDLYKGRKLTENPNLSNLKRIRCDAEVDISPKTKKRIGNDKKEINDKERWNCETCKKSFSLKML